MSLLHSLSTLVYNIGPANSKLWNDGASVLPVNTSVPHWWDPLVLGPQGSRSSSLGIITDRSSYPVVDCRRPSFLSCLFLNEVPCHVTSALSPPSFLAVVWRLIFSAVSFRRLSVVPVNWVVIGHLDCFLLLTYLTVDACMFYPLQLFICCRRHQHHCRCSQVTALWSPAVAFLQPWTSNPQPCCLSRRLW